MFQNIQNSKLSYNTYKDLIEPKCFNSRVYAV